MLANELIESLMRKVSLMTRREMKQEACHLELIQTANLKPYEYLYYVFDDEILCGDESETDEEMELLLKRQKVQFTLFDFKDQILKFNQTYCYTKAFELVNKSTLRFKAHKNYWATNFTALDNSGMCGFIDQNFKGL